MIDEINNPKALGYRFPAEWERHEATWLSWPHKEESWPGKLHTVYGPYAQFVATLAQGERVCINLAQPALVQQATQHLLAAGAAMDRVQFFAHPTNDAWCRDHGPAFLLNEKAQSPLCVVDWGYNAWGNKYPPFDMDDEIPTLVARALNLPLWYPHIVMEGGSIEVNGLGDLLTTRACLLNPNRNPHLNQTQVEAYLRAYYGVDHIMWLGDGIVGDDTDGHIDDLTRFVNQDTVVTVVEHNMADENYAILQENLKELSTLRLGSGKQLNVVELPMPSPVVWEDQRLPASYANFYIANAAVVVPTFRDPMDQVAIDTLQALFTDRPVVGIDSRDVIWGLGSWHCLSQQQPAVPA